MGLEKQRGRPEHLLRPPSLVMTGSGWDRYAFQKTFWESLSVFAGCPGAVP